MALDYQTNIALFKAARQVPWFEFMLLFWAYYMSLNSESNGPMLANATL
jgi:hypothetical protein